MDEDAGMPGGMGGMFGGAGGARARKSQAAPQSVQRPLPVTLEDLFKGTTKRLKVTRRTTSPTSGAPSTTDKILTVNIKPGWKPGTKIKFAGEGDELPTGGSQDIEFVIEEKPHPRFKREGDNLKTEVEVDLWEALCGFTRRIPHLDDRVIPVSGAQGDKPVKPGEEIVVRGEGMPISKQPGKRGDLIVTVKVKFPERVTKEQKDLVKRAFPPAAA
ncbi:hypothetical protein HK104_007807 [Borealophlyctis nickersoniae]|nr:hypothetical protein HK104_007807 [Borealophlyctis nickersoniae]